MYLLRTTVVVVGLVLNGIFATAIGEGEAARHHRRQSTPVGRELDSEAADPLAILSSLQAIKPTATPTNIAQVSSALEAIHSTAPTSLFENVAAQIEAGVVPGNLNEVVDGLARDENSQNNANPINPGKPVYPKKSAGDAPFSLSEAQLRAAIFIPDGFTYGAKPPTLFIPGTGSNGGSSFGSNLRKLLTNTTYADPVWLNVPGSMLGDTQINSEYIAYAINYISGISRNSNISIISWSQGGLDTQWVFTFWPSTRSVVSDFLPVSPDFRGSVTGGIFCILPCTPAFLQQESTSKYLATLASHGGLNAYVPTTTFYTSNLDEIVQPQKGTSASAYILDGRGVGVSNNEVQAVCGNTPGGGFYGHAGVLYNPLTYALVVDALTHDGPGNPSRLNLNQVCAQYAAPGLTSADVTETTGLIAVALVLVLQYPDKRSIEPATVSYARA